VPVSRRRPSESAGHDFEVVPSGNGVNLEDEMLKVASIKWITRPRPRLPTRGLGLIKTALGKG
jgi:flagellar basal-body rod protein FlgB